MPNSIISKYEIIQQVDGFNINLLKITPENVRAHTPYHWHNDIEIIHNISGEQIIETSFNSVLRKVTLHEDECFLINPRLPHATYSTPDNTFLVLQLPYQLLKGQIPNFDNLYFTTQHDENDLYFETKKLQLKELLFDMHTLLEIKPDGYGILFTSHIYKLIYYLYHNFSIETSSDPGAYQDKNAYRISTIIEYVQNHYASQISLDEIADICHLQPQYFCRFFKKNIGKTFLEYLNDIRLAHISIRLLQTKDPIQKIVFENGFTNYDVFRKSFKKQFQCTPKEFRKRHKTQ